MIGSGKFAQGANREKRRKHHLKVRRPADLTKRRKGLRSCPLYRRKELRAISRPEPKSHRTLWKKDESLKKHPSYTGERRLQKT